MAEPSEPTPEERAKTDAAAKKKEQEEQSKLPYKWTQQIGDLDITAPIPSNLKGKDLDVKITKTSLKAGIKGQDILIDVGRLEAKLQLLRLTAVNRVPSHIQSTSTNLPGHSRLPPPARSSTYTLTRPTRWNGGHML